MLELWRGRARRFQSWWQHWLAWVPVWLLLFGKRAELMRCLSNMQEADDALLYAQAKDLQDAQAFSVAPVDVPELVRAAREELDDGMVRLGGLLKYERPGPEA